MLLLALALLVFPFIPATNLFFYVGFVVAERVLYIPSTGYCLLVSVAVSTCRLRRKHGMMLLLVLSLAARTLVRNADWLNEESLYRSGISVNPAKGLSLSAFISLPFFCRQMLSLCCFYIYRVSQKM